jgi:hypothetical protein
VRKAFVSISLIWADGGYGGKLVQWAKQTAKLVLETVREPRWDAHCGARSPVPE